MGTNCISQGQQRNVFRQLLAPLEGEALLDWCKQLFRWWPPQIDHLTRMAEIILHGHLRASGSPPRKPSKDWYKRFLKRSGQYLVDNSKINGHEHMIPLLHPTTCNTCWNIGSRLLAT